ncbi:6539_t:CDS:2 [Entrophospora sp. SA101]|nr:10925_t:CDS:2 [Entrophospora sp. SA101]CAJ0749731.1 6539_t:CDS:2 [Entrophospora sp. SA101]CAJ0834824.1 13091_t:CDS:2 [Entrophospora sp. SA101]CAJ0864654.1 2843_t:CDS:2 [Entrophospora sp. SA101]CAJ0875789.1 14028_t:CDS:2 [Entrophospora sp. SA101]
MKIIPIPVLDDNYSYLVIDEKTNEAIVDPVEPSKILPVIEDNKVKLKHLITTHHHHDHSGGNKEMVKLVKGLTVYGSDERIPELNHPVKNEEEFKIGEKIQCKALFTPCHTSGSVSFYVQDGDTLFIGGCGKFFEGTAEQMYNSLIKTLGVLPSDTKVYCGHEYTTSNLRFAKSIDPNNKTLLEKYEWAAQNKITVPSTIGDEFKFNPFMRVEHEDMKKVAGGQDPIEIMKKLREMKNEFK